MIKSIKKESCMKYRALLVLLVSSTMTQAYEYRQEKAGNINNPLIIENCFNINITGFCGPQEGAIVIRNSVIAVEDLLIPDSPLSDLHLTLINSTVHIKGSPRKLETLHVYLNNSQLVFVEDFANAVVVQDCNQASRLEITNQSWLVVAVKSLAADSDIVVHGVGITEIIPYASSIKDVQGAIRKTNRYAILRTIPLLLKRITR